MKDMCKQSTCPQGLAAQKQALMPHNPAKPVLMYVCLWLCVPTQVYVISRNRNKEAQAKEMGAKAVIPSGDEEEMKKFAGTSLSSRRAALGHSSASPYVSRSLWCS